MIPANKIGKEICKIFNIDPKTVRSIVLEMTARDAAWLIVESYKLGKDKRPILDTEAKDVVTCLEKYKLVVSEDG